MLLLLYYRGGEIRQIHNQNTAALHFFLFKNMLILEMKIMSLEVMVIEVAVSLRFTLVPVEQIGPE